MATEETKLSRRRTLTILWRIEHISMLMDSGTADATFVSPDFAPRSLQVNRLRMTLNAKDDSGKHNPRLKLHCKSRLEYEWSIVGGDGTDLAGGTMRNHSKKSISYMDRCRRPKEELFVTRNSEFFPNDTLTIRCRIWRTDDKELPDDEFIAARTRCGGVRDSFVWPISMCGDLRREVMACKRLIFHCFGESVDLDLQILRTRGMVSVTLTPHHDSCRLTTVNLVMKVSVLDTEQKVVKRKVAASVPLYSVCVLIPELVQWSDLVENKARWWSNGVLSLLCEFVVFDKFTQSIDANYFGFTKFPENNPILSRVLRETGQTSSSKNASPTFQGKDSLAEDILRLYTDKNLTDFEIRCEDVTFRVHRIVLSARSPVFRAMLCSGMMETLSNSVDIPDVDHQTLKRMLRFMYGCAIDDLVWSTALKLYYAADKYLVESLKRRCCSFFRSYIEVTNVCDVVSLAYWHQDSDLKSIAHNFIRGHFLETQRTPEWKRFALQENELAKNTIREFYIDVKEPKAAAVTSKKRKLYFV